MTAQWRLIAQYMPVDRWMGCDEIQSALGPLCPGDRPPYRALQKLKRLSIVDRRHSEEDARRIQYRKRQGVKKQ